MIIVKHISRMREILEKYRSQHLSIGFVPTMGALHAGHISLIAASRQQHPVTVCSIFVNPRQFNSPEDFKHYPITVEQDIKLLEASGCELLFLPSVTEMYPAGKTTMHYQLGEIENLLEGLHRPGHFQGVCQVVDALLLAVQPHTIFLGQKDYQQCMVIGKMIALQQHDVAIKIVPTLREPGGLAMSSRNMRLNAEERTRAVAISAALTQIKRSIAPGNTDLLQINAAASLQQQGFAVDYVAICDATTLHPVHEWNGQQKIVALAAASIGPVRLIDNMLLN